MNFQIAGEGGFIIAAFLLPIYMVNLYINLHFFTRVYAPGLLETIVGW